MRSASIYQRNGEIFVDCMSKTTVGLWIASGPVKKTSAKNIGEIERLVRISLGDSKEGVRHPGQDEWGIIGRENLKGLGVRSFKEFAKSAKLVSIYQDGNTIQLVPTAYKGPRNGYLPLQDKVQVIGLDENLGEAVISALSVCE